MAPCGCWRGSRALRPPSSRSCVPPILDVAVPGRSRRRLHVRDSAPKVMHGTLPSASIGRLAPGITVKNEISAGKDLHRDVPERPRDPHYRPPGQSSPVDDRPAAPRTSTAYRSSCPRSRSGRSTYRRTSGRPPWAGRTSRDARATRRNQRASSRGLPYPSLLRHGPSHPSCRDRRSWPFSRTDLRFIAK